MNRGFIRWVEYNYKELALLTIALVDDDLAAMWLGNGLKVVSKFYIWEAQQHQLRWSRKF
jgi:hypothetical protein